MPITGAFDALQQQIKRLNKLAQAQAATDIAERANAAIDSAELAIFDSRTDPATGAAWDDNLDGTPGDQVKTGAGRQSIRFQAIGPRLRLKFADHLKWNISWRGGQGHGGGHKQNFIPSMGKLPPTMRAALMNAARAVFAEYGFDFGGAT